MPQVVAQVVLVFKVVYSIVIALVFKVVYSIVIALVAVVVHELWER